MKLLILLSIFINTAHAKDKPTLIMNKACDIKTELAHIALAECYEKAHKTLLWNVKTEACWEVFGKANYCNTIIKD